MSVWREITRETVVEAMKTFVKAHNMQEPNVVFWPKQALHLLEDKNEWPGLQHAHNYDYGDTFQVLGCHAVVSPCNWPVFARRAHVSGKVTTGPDTKISTPVGQIIHETICGGITRDTLGDALGRCMPNAQPLFGIINNVTVMDIAKFAGPIENREELINHPTIERTIEGVRWLITIHRDIIPDDQIRVLGTDGNLYIIDFC